MSTRLCHALLKADDGNLYGIGIDKDDNLVNSHLRNSTKVVDLEKHSKMNLRKFDSLHSFVGGRMFSAFLAKKNNLYIWGEINSYDSSYITYTYLVPLLNPVENKMYRDILFSKKF